MRVLAIAFAAGCGLGALTAIWVDRSIDARRALAAAEAARAATVALNQKEAERLAAEAEAADLRRQLEDAAHASPVTVPVAVPLERVRRLNQIR